ncbi:gamma-glutamyltransferase family protein [Streptomyces sp. NPDC021218]|uniref:gamma-glutamyltransferase family protein n=1 Tax=Streptomyces sp. NPDC021218 TaxID=3365119 RepID=UPI003787479D
MTNHRPAVGGRNGVVTSAHQLATQAGMRMLWAGGNAVDAAVAVAAALSVVEPCSSGPAGVGYMLIRAPQEPAPTVLDFVGPAPEAAHPGRFTTPGSKDVGILSAMVPGAAAGWSAALERYGTMDLATVLAPAITHAEQGFPVSHYLHHYLAAARPRLELAATSREIFLPNGRVPRPGELLIQKNAANTLRLIAEAGAEALCQGPIAEEIIQYCADHGGLLAAPDLADFAPRWQDAISSTYRGLTVYCPPAPSAALEYLVSLRMLSEFPLSTMAPDGDAYLHLLSEVFKVAIEERKAHLLDPSPQYDDLLSDAHIAAATERLDLRRATAFPGERHEYNPALEWTRAVFAGPENTTHFVTADAQGYVVSCTQTLGGAFGSGVVAGTTGLLLNSFASWFDTDPASPNAIGPGKRVEVCLAPSQVWSDGEPFLVVGTPGSHGILQTTPQMILNVVDHRMDIQEAIEAPRIRVGHGTLLGTESRFSAATLAGLRGRGHQMHDLGSWSRVVGGGHGVAFDPDTSTMWGGADPRRDGFALAW